MSGLVVTAVKRAIKIELDDCGKSRLAMDRVWMWQLIDLKATANWPPLVSTAAINHFLSVVRENKSIRLRKIKQSMVLRARPGERGVPSEATAPPPGRAATVPASNTSPESRNLRQIEGAGG